MNWSYLNIIIQFECLYYKHTGKRNKILEMFLIYFQLNFSVFPCKLKKSNFSIQNLSIFLYLTLLGLNEFNHATQKFSHYQICTINYFSVNCSNLFKHLIGTPYNKFSICLESNFIMFLQNSDTPSPPFPFPLRSRSEHQQNPVLCNPALLSIV